MVVGEAPYSPKLEGWFYLGRKRVRKGKAGKEEVETKVGVGSPMFTGER
jgi:hypothetical protein